MAIRHNSPVLVIIWPDGQIEVTQVIAKDVQDAAIKAGAICKLIKVNGNTPATIKYCLIRGN